jgi:hypothetical protein
MKNRFLMEINLKYKCNLLLIILAIFTLSSCSQKIEKKETIKGVEKKQKTQYLKIYYKVLGKSKCRPCLYDCDPVYFLSIAPSNSPDNASFLYPINVGENGNYFESYIYTKLQWDDLQNSDITFNLMDFGDCSKTYIDTLVNEGIKNVLYIVGDHILKNPLYRITFKILAETASDFVFNLNSKVLYCDSKTFYRPSSDINSSSKSIPVIFSDKKLEPLRNFNKLEIRAFWVEE